MPEHHNTDMRIELSDGGYFDPANPTAPSIQVIAHSLARQCRFTGHSRLFYSVAEHSVLCSLLAEELEWCDPMEALMHDAHEAMISDLAAPWRRHVPDFRECEKRCETALREAYELPERMSGGCKSIDYLALFIEAYFLLPSRGEGWADPLTQRVRALKMIKREGWQIRGLEPEQARNAFMQRYQALTRSFVRG